MEKAHWFSCFPHSRRPLKRPALVKLLLSILVRACLLAALFAAAASHAAPKKAEVRPVAPPPPVARKISLERGQQIVVPLAIYGAGVEGMEYVIRSAPKYGKLSAVQITGPITAAVTYTAPEQTTATEDRFTYAVRSSDGVSAAVPVIITISEAAALPPRLVVPAAVEMPPIRPGETSSVVLELKNTGGGFAEGALDVAEPWKVDGSPKFRLGGGSKAEFTVTFSSSTTGPHKAELSYGARQRVSTTLNVAVLAPITFSPALIELKTKPGVTTRAGQVRITNAGTESVMVAIKHGGKLLTETSLTIPGRSDHTLAVFAEPGEVGTVEDKLQFTAGAWSSEVPVIAPALGPIVSCREKSVAFAEVAMNRTAQSSVTLENTGGTAIALSFSANGPFRADPTSVALKPKSTATIAVLCKAESVGTVLGKLSIVGTDVRIEVPLSAQVAAAALVRATPRNTQARVVKSNVEPEKEMQPAFANTPSLAAEIPNLVGKVTKATPTSATFAWKAGALPERRAQVRSLSAAPNGLISSWADVRATFRQDGEMTVCDIDKLTPATHYTFRVVSGKTVECTVSISTPAKPPFFPFGWRSVLIAALCSTAVWMLWTRWKTSGRSGW